MDDVAGCRLIFSSLSELYDFRASFHKARFSHKRRNDVDRYDYIKTPKPTGYRGIHDVYMYDVNSFQGRALKGLLVEIQYRTLVQHTWATAVEVVDLITGNQPKFERGDTRYVNAMALASEILARHYERLTGPFPEASNRELVSLFRKADRDLRLLDTLGRLATSRTHLTGKDKGNIILKFGEQGQLEFQSFRDAPDALKALFEIERQFPGTDVVLVRADSSEDVRLAFKNYFSDAKEFVEMIQLGCDSLSPRRV
jgi:hypothetical protein